MIFGGGGVRTVCSGNNSILFRMFHVLIFKIDIPLILCGCEIWFLTSREEHRLRVFASRVVGIFDVRGRKGQRDAEDSVVSFMAANLHQIIMQIDQGPV
jgi:hypothetical protein